MQGFGQKNYIKFEKTLPERAPLAFSQAYFLCKCHFSALSRALSVQDFWA